MQLYLPLMSIDSWWVLMTLNLIFGMLTRLFCCNDNILLLRIFCLHNKLYFVVWKSLNTNNMYMTTSDIDHVKRMRISRHFGTHNNSYGTLLIDNWHCRSRPSQRLTHPSVRESHLSQYSLSFLTRSF